MSLEMKYLFELCYSHVLRRCHWRWCSGVRSCGSSPEQMRQRSIRIKPTPEWLSSYTVTGEGVAAYAVVVLDNC
jgi:hypothetical protein